MEWDKEVYWLVSLLTGTLTAQLGASQCYDWLWERLIAKRRRETPRAARISPLLKRPERPMILVIKFFKNM